MFTIFQLYPFFKNDRDFFWEEKEEGERWEGLRIVEKYQYSLNKIKNVFAYIILLLYVTINESSIGSALAMFKKKKSNY